MNNPNNGPPYHWTFKIPRGDDCLIESVMAAVKNTDGVTYRPRKRQGETVVIGVDVNFADTGAEVMLRLRLPSSYAQYLSCSASWNAVP